MYNQQNIINLDNTRKDSLNESLNLLMGISAIHTLQNLNCRTAGINSSFTRLNRTINPLLNFNFEKSPNTTNDYFIQQESQSKLNSGCSFFAHNFMNKTNNSFHTITASSFTSNTNLNYNQYNYKLNDLEINLSGSKTKQIEIINQDNSTKISNKKSKN